MRILGIDTATVTASVALVEDGRLVLEEICDGEIRGPSHSSPVERANHAQTLLPLVDRVLKKASVPLEGINALAISIGPGSFTGLRIGLSTVKGLAYACAIPVVAVPTLLAVALRVTGWQGLICPFLDARKKEVYAALFRKRDESLVRLTGDLVDSPERVVKAVPSSPEESCLFIGEGTRIYGDVINEHLADRGLITLGEGYPSIASAVAQVAVEKVQNNSFDVLGSLVPLYLRPPEAELRKSQL
jgi:tRNA threonylcarbamoyladenosine biosynthesis protein TsaB